MKPIIATTLAVLAAACTAQCEPVLSIFDPQGGFSFVPPTQATSQYYVGQTFAISILASGSNLIAHDGPNNLYGFSFDLSFNPSDLQVVPNGVGETGYFAQNGVSFYNSVDNSSGVISYVSDAIAGPGPGENLAYSQPLLGSDPLVTVTFKAVGAGNSNISFVQNGDLYFVDSQGNFTTPVTGAEEVITYPLLGSRPPAPVPEPGTAGMAGLAGIVVFVSARFFRASHFPRKN